MYEQLIEEKGMILVYMCSGIRNMWNNTAIILIKYICTK
nr:MAG TPA: Latrophilin Cytoplasmic C-terminal region [Caudoviricetes sp.]